MALAMRIGQETKVISTKNLGCGLAEDLFYIFLFWRSPKFGQKNRLNFGEDLFFCLEITSIWTKKTTQSNSRPIKIWVKIVCCCFQPPKQPVVDLIGSERSEGTGPPSEDAARLV